ncbi:MAG: hypothetical protein KGR26_03190, partial [Cyanobacteria bacterium REEB65]|nr:hypothetical protein [Cyanobacteria bacterium REEB65]
LSPTVAVATASHVLLGGAVADTSGLWLTWVAESGASASVQIAKIAGSGLAVGPETLSTSAMPSTVPETLQPSTSYTSAQPTLARNSAGDLLVAWIDDRDSTSNTPLPRVYGQVLDPTGTPISQAMALQYDNQVSPIATPHVLVSRPTLASDGNDFLAAWQEADPSVYQLVLQGIAADGSRLVSGGEAGAGSNSYANKTIAQVETNLQDPQLAWNPSSQTYDIVYTGSDTTGSNVYFQSLNGSGQAASPGGPVVVVDDSRSEQGQAQCPSFNPGVPCGQGIRLSPQIVWNGRDEMLAWEMDRNDGVVAIQGARLAPDGNRAAEEPGSPRPLSTLPRSVAEILYTFAPGQPYVPEPGAQIRPRLAWADDVAVIGWLEAGSDPDHLIFKIRLWR